MTNDFEQFHLLWFVNFMFGNKTAKDLINSFGMEASLAAYAGGVIDYDSS